MSTAETLSYESAFRFIDHLKTSLLHDPSAVQKLLEALQLSKRTGSSVDQVVTVARTVLQDRQDLMRELNAFLPSFRRLPLGQRPEEKESPQIEDSAPASTHVISSSPTTIRPASDQFLPERPEAVGIKALGESPVIIPVSSPHAPPTPQAPIRPKFGSALDFLDEVKKAYPPPSPKYGEFLAIMGEFQAKSLDTGGVVKRVAALFAGEALLIEHFNIFLPYGYAPPQNTKSHADESSTALTDMEPLLLELQQGSLSHGKRRELLEHLLQLIARAKAHEHSRISLTNT